MVTRTLIFTLAAFALLPMSAALAGRDHSEDYGHHTVGADSNDDSGNVEHDEHPRGDFDNGDGGDSARRKAEDGRYSINHDRNDDSGEARRRTSGNE